MSQISLGGSPAPLFLPVGLDEVETLDVLDGFDAYDAHPIRMALVGPSIGCDWDDGYQPEEVWDGR